jgi:hypothetical protein
MVNGADNNRLRSLTTPRAAAVAGIVFALLFATALVLMRLAIPETISGETDWIERGSEELSVALLLMPLAGIAFLWFVGVIRDQLGAAEDKFFSTVLLGSGLLFLAMVFMSVALAGGMLTGARALPAGALDDDVIIFGRAVMLQISNVYALRMAGLFMTSLGTIWFRTGLMPRWLAVATYALAAVLLLVINLSLWITLVFPAWVFFVSAFILVRQLRG